MDEEKIKTVPANLIGTNVPNMTLPVFQNGEIETMEMNSLKGKWYILFFYPSDFTFVCPTELEEMADLYEEFKSLNTEIVGVSTDTAYAHKAWHDTSPSVNKIKFPMAADPTTRLTQSLGIYLEDEGVSLRGSFIVNPEGKIITMEVNDNGIGRSAKELLRKLKAAQFVDKNGDKVCPASWQEGDDGLEPSADLVGKI